MVELVGERHQQVAPNPRLDVLLGDILIETGEKMAERGAIAVEKIRYRQNFEATTAAPGKRLGIFQGFL